MGRLFVIKYRNIFEHRGGRPGKGAEDMQKTQNLQDTFLNQARRSGLPLTVFLMNGFQLKGVVRGFDNFTVVLDSDGRQQMIYKHAISTIIPSKPLALRDENT